MDSSELNFRWLHSHTLEALEQQTPLDSVEDIVGAQDSPDFRSVLVTQWDIGSHAVTWIANYISSYTNSDDEKVSSNVIHDLLYQYDLGANGELSIGVRNVLDKDPPLDPFNDTSQPFNSELYTMDGRIPYITYRHRF